MNAKDISTKHADLIAAIAAGLKGKATAAGESAKANESVSQALRDYAKATAEEDVDEARKALQVNLTFADVKSGTVKGCGNFYTGFRAMLAKGINIDDKGEGKPYTAADAQAFIASDGVKRIKALRAAIGEVVKDAAKKTEGDSTDSNPETRLKELAEMIGADLKEYDALLQTGIGEEEESEGQAQAA